MARDERFNFICSEEERQLIAAVAKKLERSQSDAIRLLVRGAAEELGVVTGGEPVPAGEQGNEHGR